MLIHHEVEAELQDAFRMTPEIHEKLRAFQPAEGQDPCPWDKWNEILWDLTPNHGHRDTLRIFDLCWHSVLSFRFDGEPVDKGWVTALVMADSGQEITRIAQAMPQRYGMGTYLSGENMDFRKLLFNHRKTKKGNPPRTLKYGVLPTLDNGLLVLDNFHQLSTETRRKLIVSNRDGLLWADLWAGGSARVRTRLIMLAETGTPTVPRQDWYDRFWKFLRYDKCICALDLADIVSQEEAASETPPSAPSEPRYPSALCHDLIRWVWSRQPEQVEFTEDAVTEVFNGVRILIQGYPSLTNSLLLRETLRWKIARLSVALAGRLFSTDESGERIIVTPGHAQAGTRLFVTLYTRPEFGGPVVPSEA